MTIYGKGCISNYRNCSLSYVWYSVLYRMLTFVVIYTKECINLQIRKVHYIRHIIGTSTDWFSAWSDDGVKVTMVILLFVIFPIVL